MPGKLVRDKIPDLQRAEGLSPVVTVDRSLGPLLAKLREEAAELGVAVAGGNREAIVEEAADLCEVWEAIRDAIFDMHGVHILDLVRAQRIKREAKGGFEAGYILHDGAAPRRLAYRGHAAVQAPRLRALLLDRGWDVPEVDVAIAYEAYSVAHEAEGWLDLDAELELRGGYYVTDWLACVMTEVPS